MRMECRPDERRRFVDGRASTRDDPEERVADERVSLQSTDSAQSARSRCGSSAHSEPNLLAVSTDYWTPTGFTRAAYTICGQRATMRLRPCR